MMMKTTTTDAVTITAHAATVMIMAADREIDADPGDLELDPTRPRVELTTSIPGSVVVDDTVWLRGGQKNCQ